MNPDYSSDPSDSRATGSGAMGSASTYSGISGSDESSQDYGDRLRTELSNLKGDLDALMSKASSLSDVELREARDRLMQQLDSWRYSAKGMADQASEQLAHGMDVTTDYVKEKPLQSVAIAAGIGLVLGALLRR